MLGPIRSPETPNTPEPTPDDDVTGGELLLATLGAVMLAVAGVWLIALTSSAWAVLIAVILVLFGVVAVVTVITTQLNDETGTPRSSHRC
jgi:membrane protein implicated in regulation of membrane protease activity